MKSMMGRRTEILFDVEKMIQMTLANCYGPVKAHYQQQQQQLPQCIVKDDDDDDDDYAFLHLRPSIVSHHPSTVVDTTAPTCVTRREYYFLHRLANADPRQLVFHIINPATDLPDEAFKASIIDRYRGTVYDDDDDIAEAALGGSLLKRPCEDIGNAHEVLPGASVLKRFREELGKSSERAFGLKRFREELGQSSDRASGLKRFREGLGESSESASVLKRFRK